MLKLRDFLLRGYALLYRFRITEERIRALTYRVRVVLANSKLRNSRKRPSWKTLNARLPPHVDSCRIYYRALGRTFRFRGKTFCRYPASRIVSREYIRDSVGRVGESSLPGTQRGRTLKFPPTEKSILFPAPLHT